MHFNRTVQRRIFGCVSIEFRHCNFTVRPFHWLTLKVQYRSCYTKLIISCRTRKNGQYCASMLFTYTLLRTWLLELSDKMSICACNPVCLSANENRFLAEWGTVLKVLYILFVSLLNIYLKNSNLWHLRYS